jgi:CDP-glucose 4,6-dehydratase
LASARAGNVIGGGDWSDDRLIPDILNAFEKSEPVTIRNPNSTRPWQHVLEPISGYFLLAENLYNHGNSFAEGWNFGPKDEGCKSVEWILDKMVANWGDGASWEIDEQNNPHEANFLKLDCSKAANRLEWEPKWTLEDTLQMITDWHYNYLNGNDIKLECLKEIEKYTS